ncbi:MAG: flagellar export chaperone FlgN [Spirochaetaceae bacterium]|jgi:hypothetical protein|nr:flagellar export chaperone FlgN [Spirochaetaceae bacterium]
MNNGIDKDIPDYRRCAVLLAKEAEILEKVTSLLDAVKTAVMNRDWTDFDGLLDALQEYVAGFEHLERDRIRLFAAFTEGGGGGDGWVGFYALIARLPPVEREELSAAYRALRMEVLRMRLRNEALLEEINEARSVVAAFLNAACPDRGGKLYSRQGAHAPPDMRSMVFNRHF